jgi:hypothetical protein
MVSLWYPGTREALRHPRARYVFAQLRLVLIRSGLGSTNSLTMRTNARDRARPQAGLLPVVLFSPAFGGPRVGYQVLAEDLARNGWLVVAVDHTGEVPIEFPHGKIVAATPCGQAGRHAPALVQARACECLSAARLLRTQSGSCRQRGTT